MCIRDSGRVVDIVDRETGEIIPSYISIDRKTNEITDIPANKVRIPERIGKTEITTQERDAHPACRNVRDFIRLAVDADVGGEMCIRDSFVASLVLPSLFTATCVRLSLDGATCCALSGFVS